MSEHVSNKTWTIPPLVVRAIALALAVASHGAAPGKESDRCFPARAREFERYLTGEDTP